MLCSMLSDTFWCRKETAYDEFEVKNDLPDFLYERMLELKEGLVINLRTNTFERNCLEANELLISQNLFLEFSKLKKKFSICWSRFKKKNIKRELFPCIVEKFSGYEIVRFREWNKLGAGFKPIDTYYKL